MALTVGFLSFDFRKEAILLIVPLTDFLISSVVNGTIEFTATSGDDKGLLFSFVLLEGAPGAGLKGTFGAFRRGEINSLAVQVEFSRTGDEIIGLALLPGFGGGKAGATDAVLASLMPLFSEGNLKDGVLGMDGLCKKLFVVAVEFE